MLWNLPKNYPTKETEQNKPIYPYALTKKMAEEDLIIHWGNLYNIPFISLRLFNVYGTRSRTSGTYGAMFGVFLAHRNYQITLSLLLAQVNKLEISHMLQM